MSEITPTIYWAYTESDHTLRIGNSTLYGDNSGSFNGADVFYRAPWNQYLEDSIRIVDIVTSVSPTSIKAWFNFLGSGPDDCWSYIKEMKNTKNLDVSNVTSMRNLLIDSNVEVLDLSTWDTHNVTDMAYAFEENSYLTKIYVSEKWSTQAVLDSENMFRGCTKLVGAIPYDSTKTNATYANYETGYFTYKDWRPQLDIRLNAKTQSAYDILHPRTLAQYISYDNSNSGLSATNVYDAILELYDYPKRWIKSDMASDSELHGLTYGNDKYVVVGDGNIDTYVHQIAYSTNGKNWSYANPPSYQSTSIEGDVCYGNGMFIARANTSGTQKMLYSTNGSTWSAVNLPSSGSAFDTNWYKIAYGANKFVVLGYGNQKVLTSTNGTTWTATTVSNMPQYDYYYWLLYNGNIFLAISSTTDSVMMSSTNGTTWTTINPQWEGIDSKFIDSACYGNGQFVVMIRDSDLLFTSTDGHNWSKKTLPQKIYSGQIGYGDGKFTVLGKVVGGWNAKLISFSSTDLNIWQNIVVPDEAPSSNNYSIKKIVCNGEQWVAIGDRFALYTE